MINIIKPLQPIRDGWESWGEHTVMLGYPCERWFHPSSEIQVISAVEVANDKDGSSNGPEYHISVSRLRNPLSRAPKPERVDTNDAKFVLAEFGVDGAEEDNHVPNGIARHFWRPVASGLVGKECKCKAEEVVIRENRGDFIWRP